MAPLGLLSRLLLVAWLRAQALVHAGALVLLALVVATESADDPLPTLLSRLSIDVPHTWALLSPALTLAAAALAVARLLHSGELLALGTLGVSRLRVLLSGVGVTLPLAALAAAVGRGTDPAVEVARGPGAWVVHGIVLLDPGTTGVSAADLAGVEWGSPAAWPGTALLVVLGGIAGAALGAADGRRSVVAAAAVWLVLDLVRRGSEPAPGLVLLALAAGFAATLLRSATGARRGAPRSPAHR
ncbi:hypothetical protein LBMAG42_27280 [Deltaproteobacteria bacterium]|nr:hypothetical protein LBMAG42_27280 [Deltaproteobacteria bacterium]